MQYKKRRIDGKWHRLIPSRFPPVDVYERLGSSELGAIAKELETKTNPRLQARARLLDKGSGLTETSPQLQNWNHAPFAYKNPEGSTFLNPAYGVLEVVRGIRPALAWALLRRETFLARTEEPAMGLDMRLLVTKVRGDFVDLTNAPFDENQESRWRLGQKLYEDGAAGVLFWPPEQPRILVLAVFDNSVLRLAVQSTHYRFIWDGKVVRSVYDFTDDGKTDDEKTMLREELLAECGGREAA